MELKILIGFVTIMDINAVYDCLLRAAGTQCNIYAGYIDDHVFSETLCYSRKEI